MAHLLVTSETVIVDQSGQENVNRSIGKHKRGGGLVCHEGSAWPGSDTKRRALVSITNHPNLIASNSSNSFSNAIQKKFPIKATVSNSSLVSLFQS